MNSAFLLPLILICLSIIPCFFIIKRFVGNIGAIFGSIILAIHPALLARTPAGFSDTDAYNIFFPLMVVWLIIESFRAKDLKNKLLLSATSGLFIGLYSFTWAGWWNTFDFILAGLLTYFIILLFKFRKNIYKNKLSRNFLYNSFTFIFSSSIFITIFTNFQTLLTSITSPINTIFIKEIAKSSLWPNVYTTVAELNEVAFAGILTNLGGLIFFLMSFIGISIIIFNSKYKLSKLKYSIIFLFWFMGTFYASTKGIRFTLLMVPVFSIGIGIFVGKIYDYLKKLIKKQLDIDKRLITIMLILGLVFLLLPLINDANQIQKQGRPSFNDAWYNSLTNIRENSNEDSIITSWWDFGHWFKYYSNRAVTFDGGSQNRPQAHWVGKLLLTNNEDESMGILRMLNCGGNNAYDLILQKTQSEIDSINILNEILLKSKEEAKTILELRDLPVADILKKTHCSPRDNFLITSQDMVNKAGVWGHFGAWDFEKSLMYNKFNNNLDFNLESLGYSEQELKEIENLILTSSDEDLNSWIAPYPSYSGNFGDCINQEEFILCNNGVVIDTLNKISKIQTNDGIIDIGIYRDTINFYESGQDTELAIAYFEETNKSLIMASELIGSLFTELYYYESKNLKNFELFDKQIGVDGFKIYTWKIKW